MIKYLCLSDYTLNSAKGFQLGKTYMQLSAEALKDDDREVRKRNMKYYLEDKLFKEKDERKN